MSSLVIKELPVVIYIILLWLGNLPTFLKFEESLCLHGTCLESEGWIHEWKRGDLLRERPRPLLPFTKLKRPKREPRHQRHFIRKGRAERTRSGSSLYDVCMCTGVSLGTRQIAQNQFISTCKNGGCETWRFCECRIWMPHRGKFPFKTLFLSHSLESLCEQDSNRFKTCAG